MPQLAPSLRKAAVLISALDTASAEALLEQMTADDAAKVRHALVELDDIGAEEQEQVLADFFNRRRPENTNANQADVSLELDPQVEAAASDYRQPSRISGPSSQPADFTSFDFLQEVEPLAIARLLLHEHPQTAAVVVSQLPPQHAALVLEQLPAALATEALERIATIDAIDPDVLAELARGLRRQLAPHLRALTSEAAPLAHLTAVLEAMDFRQRQRLLLHLSDRNTSLLKRLGMHPSVASATHSELETAVPRYRLETSDYSTQGPSMPQSAPVSQTPPADMWLTFDDLQHFADAALRTVFAAVDAELALLALTGAAPRLIGRILRKMPAREAAILRERLERPSAVRLRDIEQARSAISAVASRLAHEGKIELPANLAFAAAV